MDLAEATLAIEPYVNKILDCHTSDDIRDLLAAENIRAVRSCSDQCALAEYISRGSGQRVVVGVVGVSVVHPDGLSEHVVPNTDPATARREPRVVVRGHHVADATTAMREFISRFDSGQYPELVAE